MASRASGNGLTAGVLELGGSIFRSRLRSSFPRYVVSIMVMATALAVTAGLNEAAPGAPSAVIFAAALLIAWIAGLAPAAITSTLAGGALVYLRQPDSGWYLNERDVLWMAQFLATVYTMAWRMPRRTGFLLPSRTR